MITPRSSFIDTDAVGLPMAMAEVHRELETGDRVELDLAVDAPLADLVVRGAGFHVTEIHPLDGHRADCTRVAATRAWELPDHVDADMRILLVGLNPSPTAADSGIGFARPGNRFWPALLASDLATVDRDPRHLLIHRHIGMTDIVKRTTSRAAELSSDDFAEGVARLDELSVWLVPRIVCFVGLQGWRTAIDRKAVAGPQPTVLGGRPTYVMPNPSGLNANHRLDDFVEHFRALAALADSVT